MVIGVSFKTKWMDYRLNRKLRRAYNLKRYDEVEHLCDQLLELNYEDTTALEFQGRLHTNRKEHELALSYWERLSKLEPSNPQWLLRRARANFNLERFEEAMEACQRVMEFNAGDLEARTLAARIHLKWGDIESAEALSPLDTEHDGAIITSIGLARLAYRLGRYEKAEAICNKIIDKDPEDLKALELLGRIYSNQRRHDVALGLWQRLGTLKPEDRFINLKITKACYNMGDYPGSDTACDRVLAHHPNDMEALELKGRLLHRQRRWPKAVGIFQQLFDDKPENIKIASIYIKLLFRLSREQEAENALRSLIENASDDADNLLGLALLHEELLFPVEARGFLERAIKLSSNKAGLFFEIIREYIALQRLETAHYYLVKAREQNPQSMRIKPLAKRIETLFELTRTDPEDLVRSYLESRPVLIMERIIDAIIRKVEPLEPMNEPVPGRIAMVSSTLNRGGAERQVVMSLQGLQQRTDIVESLTLFSGDIDAHPDPDQTFLPILQRSNIPVFELNRPQVKPEMRKAFKDAVGPWKKYLKHLPENIRLRVENLLFQFTRLRPQIVHAWQDNTNIIAGLAAAMAGVPRIILSARSLRPDRKTRLHAINTRHARQGYLSLLRLPQVVLSVNSEAAAGSYAEWLDLDEQNIPIVHNGLDIEQMEASVEDHDPATMFQEIGLPDEVPVVGAVFRLTEEKRPHLWVQVAAQVARANPEVHFVIVGDGAMLEETRSYAQEVGLADRFHLPGQSTMVKAWLERMDLFLLTSRVEGLPNVLIEAQAFGVPVVTSDAGGAAETIRDGETGWVVKDETVEGLSERVRWCLNHPDWRSEASMKAAEQARRRFGKEQMIDRLLELYEFPGGS